MKKLLLALLMVLTVALPLFAGTARDITSKDAKSLLVAKKNAYLLDVRTPQERSQGFIPGSVLIPINEVERRLSEIPKNRPVIVYCAVGSRSRQVAQALAGVGYGEVYNMRDGIMGWYRNGYQIQR
ncbi:MAG: rhodanese-like domain-containing protein [Geobacter sp.]|nr:rhodanese-like domain-containing protein [Geobacter sp.]